MTTATQQTRLAKVLDRIAVGTSVYRTRGNDARRAQRNGNGQSEGLDKALEKLEAAADALWAGLK